MNVGRWATQIKALKEKSRKSPLRPAPVDVKGFVSLRPNKGHRASYAHLHFQIAGEWQAGHSDLARPCNVPSRPPLNQACSPAPQRFRVLAACPSDRCGASKQSPSECLPSLDAYRPARSLSSRRSASRGRSTSEARQDLRPPDPKAVNRAGKHAAVYLRALSREVQAAC